MPPQVHGPDDELLRPREVAAILGVRTATVARWARQGRLTPLLTPGGHRRYTRASVRAVLGEEPDGPPMALDTARMDAQG
jgi:excisionase family DNA binding protein